MKHKLLITSVGVYLGQCLIESLEGMRQEIYLVGTNSHPAAANIYACDKVHLVPISAEKEFFQQALTKIILEEKPDLVIPCRDEDLDVLSQLSLDPRFEQTLFLVPPEPLIKIFNDKYATHLFAKEHSLPFAATGFYAPEVEALINKSGFPLIAKARTNGYASQDVYLVENQQQVNNLLQEQAFVFQSIIHPATLSQQNLNFKDRGIPWVFSMKDIEYLSEVVIGQQGEVISMSSNLIQVTPSGAKSWHVSELASLEQVALDYAHKLGKLGYRGPLNLQGKLDETDHFIPFELNGRFTGATNARAMLGYNQLRHTITHFLEGHTAYPPHRPGDHLCALPKQQSYEAIARTAVAELQKKGYWTSSGG